MFKTNDRIGFKRSEYGAYEVGTYVGMEKSSGFTPDTYIVKDANGEEVRLCYRTTNGGSAYSNFVHHIGYITVREDFIDRNDSYECAAWYEDILVKSGSKYPLFARVRDRFNYTTNQSVEGKVEEVFFAVDGNITSDEFGSRFFGVPVSDYDNLKNAGKYARHNISLRDYVFAGKVLALRGVAPYANQSVYQTADGHFSKDFDVELLNNVDVYSYHYEYDGVAKEIGEAKILHADAV